MRVIPVNPAEPREDRVSLAASALDGGELVALPTETFYGLAVDAFQPAALRRLNLLKDKAGDTPILLLLAEAGHVEQVCSRIPERFQELAERFWPGPLTLVVPASSEVPPEVTGGRGTVAVRVPGLGLPRHVAKRLGRPISGVSANLHREQAARTAGEVARAFPSGVDLILDGGPTAGGTSSTILDLSGPRPRVLRHGLLPVTALRSHLSDLADASV